MSLCEYENIKQNFLLGRLKGCKDYFEKNKYYTQAGYCYIILDKLKEAQDCFNLVKDYDTRAKWGLFILQLINDNIHSSPTYFQLRNFLEIDLGIFILYCKEKYVEKIIKYADFMAFYNPECYKFIGRAFWANKFMPAAMFFLRRAKDKFYQDPELHYLLAYIYYSENDIPQCKKSIKTCLEILPEYNPAKKLEQIITNQLKF